MKHRRSKLSKLFTLAAALSVLVGFDTDYDSLWIDRYDAWPTTEALRWLSGPAQAPLGFRTLSHQGNPGQHEVALDDRGQLVMHGDSTSSHWSSPTQRRTIYWLRFTNWITLSAPIPLVWLGRWFWQWDQRRKRQRGGRCTACGYDLRATPEQCPECGLVPKPLRSQYTSAP